ncbi:MAG: GNAT family N-acetyltransferase [Myxococcales bacterium]
MKSRLRALVTSTTDACLAAETADGRLLGWIQVQGRCLLESDPFAEIVGLVVDGAHRSRGVGHELAAAAERWAKERGYAELRVRSNVKRERAHRFYQREGYRLRKTAHVFVKAIAEGDQRVLEKRLSRRSLSHRKAGAP